MTRRAVLVVDDSVDACELVRRQIRAEYEVFQATSVEEAKRLLSKHQIRLVVSDYELGPMDGVAMLAHLRDIEPKLVAILVSGHSEVEPLIAAMNSGLVYRFLRKPWCAEDLLLLLEQASLRLDEVEALANKKSLPASVQAISARTSNGKATSGVVAESQAMQTALQQASRVARSSATVLLQGESGTGKEVLARYIHDHSARATKPFVAVNCGALTETLLENELFGHERGAFTGADSQRPGKFESADGGTLFLDEIGDISPRLQVILLRVLEQRCFERVGGTRTIHVDVRIIAATHKPLASLVESQTFRSDLYYRLNVFPIGLPPLRQRKEDTRALAARFLQDTAKGREQPQMTPEAMRALTAHSWPGNVRELRNVMDRMMILVNGAVIDEELVKIALDGCATIESIPSQRHIEPDSPKAEVDWQEIIDSRLRSRLQDALIDCQGNQSEAAKSLGMKRTTFLYQARKSGLL